MNSSKRSFKARKETLSQVVRSVCAAVNTPRSLAIWLIFSEGSHNDLLTLEINPLHYSSAHDFGDDYLVTKMLSKYPKLRLTDIDPKEAAVRTFKECEARCRETNFRLRLDPNRAYSIILDRARKIIETTLPDLSSGTDRSRTFASIVESVGWGPGVTSSVKGDHVSVYNKIQGNLDATADLAACGFTSIVESIPSWAAFHRSANPESNESDNVKATIVRGNAVTFVPKNAKTDRPIAVEPHLNALLQKGIGSQLRSSLRKLGINLNSQKRNQDLARIGSKFGTLATIDLKSASDTVAQSIVERLLPPIWMRLLNCARSPAYKLDGEWKSYYKHSSMGNGYTFELETLLFTAISLSTCQTLGLDTTDVSVYGDDIIVPTGAYQLLTEVLDYAGFQTNSEKSFHDGPFRESCGKDYFLGSNVRPFFVREELDSLESVFRLANALSDYSHSRCSGLARDGRFYDAWRILYLSVPSDLRFRVPHGWGDAGFAGDFDECSSRIETRFNKELCRAEYRSVGYVSLSTSIDKVDQHVSVLSALWEMERLPSLTTLPVQQWTISDLERTSYDLRGRSKRRKRTILYTEWSNRGAWVTHA